LVLPRFLCSALAGLLSIAGSASAESPVLALDYSAPTSCPSDAEFQDEIRHFVPGLSVVSRSSSTRVFEVSIDASGVVGQLRVLDEQAGGSRQVQGADCAEVARLLAFAVALVLDPNLQVPEEPLPDVSGTPNAQEPATPHPAVPTPVAAPVPAPREERHVRAVTAPSRQSGRQSISAFGLAASAMSPAPTYGVGALYDIVARFGNIEPKLRLGASYSASADASLAGATVSFVNVLAHVEGCPGRLQTGSLELWPCLRVDAGARSTTGRGIPGATNRVRPWLSFDALAHVRWRLAPPVFLELGGGAVIPAWHDRVFFQPDLTVHQVPDVGWLGEMAVGVEFTDRNPN
jgi:hypothetical protein